MKAKCIKTLDLTIEDYNNQGFSLSDKYVKGNIYEYEYCKEDIFSKKELYKVEACPVFKAHGSVSGNFTPKLFNEYFEIF